MPLPATERCRVVLSYALQSSWRIIQSDAAHALTNALTFTSSPIILHISAEDPLLPGGIPRDSSWVRIWPRIHVNPQQVRVTKHTPSILAAHLSNFAHCDRPGMPCRLAGGNGRFVILSQNVVLFRHGLEDWVSRHQLSFCLSDACSDVGCRMCSHYQHTLPGLRQHLAQLAWRTHSQGLESPLVGWMRNATAARDDRYVLRRSRWQAAFYRWMRSVTVRRSEGGVWAGQRASPLGSMPHEGSFYPIW